MTDSLPDVPLSAAWRGPVVLPPLALEGAFDPDHWRSLLARHLYGAMPADPDAMSIVRHPLRSGATRLELEIRVGPRRFVVDAALWVPDGPGPAPVVCGLEFLGPAGLPEMHDFPLDDKAVVYVRPDLGVPDGRLCARLRGAAGARWPVKDLTEAGYAVLLSCYGSWVPDDPEAWQDHGVFPLLQPGRAGTGALTLWAWAIRRLVDAATRLPGLDATRVAVAGHSRLGKAALWAAAHDGRIAAVFANNSGCGGAAPARHPVGETLAQMQARFPHWVVPDAATADPEALPFDQHALLALIAPRALYLGHAASDLWADPLGSDAALAAAAPVWPQADPQPWPTPAELWHPGGQVVRGRLGRHLRSGGHDLRVEDWRGFLAFLAALPEWSGRAGGTARGE